MNVVPRYRSRGFLLLFDPLIRLLSLLLLILVVGSVESSEEDEVDFPVLVGSDDVAYFFENDDIDGLHWALSNVFARSARNPDPGQVKHPNLPEQLVSRGGGNKYTTKYKVAHDLEQAKHLADTLEDPEEAQFFRSIVVPTYESLLDRIPSLDELEKTGGLYPFQPVDYEKKIQAIYNKAIHQTSIDELKDDNGKLLPLINPDLDVEAIQNQWSGGDKSHQTPGIIYVDNLLTPEALASIQKIMHDSTVWYQTKLPLKFGGYVGAYIDDGLHDRILLHLAKDLQDKLPRILDGHALKYLWAYKYDSDYTGINLHADQAAVNVNIWLTNDDANLDPKSGGLVVFTAKPPPEWSFSDYNTNTDFVKEKLLEPTGYANVTIPYRMNRAVIFDSALFHQTDNFSFRRGYKNRRINLTLLYGDMQLPLHPKDEL